MIWRPASEPQESDKWGQKYERKSFCRPQREETFVERYTTVAPMNLRRVAVAGGGAAGIFAAIACAEAATRPKVTVLEKGPQFLSKVRISGGGRCNVTHACFEARELATRFPRGERALISPLNRFQASDTMSWFESRGVNLKVEEDGRVFPTSDSSETIIECLLGEARAAGVELIANRGVDGVKLLASGEFELAL